MLVYAAYKKAHPYARKKKKKKSEQLQPKEEKVRPVNIAQEIS